MTKVYLIHGWSGSPTSAWKPWLISELEAEGIEVIAPSMPNPDVPKIEEWVPFLKSIAPTVDTNTYFVGHSMGCQAILRYLQELPKGARVGGVVLVAPVISILNNLREGEPEIAKPWLETPIDWAKVRSHVSAVTVIYSDDDPYVPISQAELLKKSLGAKLVLDPKKGHFSEDEDVMQLPSVLRELKALM
jgi:uncharacterized protein